MLKLGPILPFIGDAFGIALLASWGWLSIDCLGECQPAFFQRLGSYGVAVGIIYFAIVFLFGSFPSPPGYAKAQHLTRLHLVELSQGVSTALRNTSLLAAALNAECKRKGEQAPKTVEALAKPLEDGHEFSAQTDKWVKFKDSSKDLFEISEDADHNVRTSRSRTEIVQAAVLVTATLQWGFGDLFHCWFNGNGWQICY